MPQLPSPVDRPVLEQEKHPPCEVGDCSEPARSVHGGPCEAHYKRRLRGSRREGPVRKVLPPEEQLGESAHRYADAEEDRAFKNARWALQYAAVSFALRSGSGRRLLVRMLLKSPRGRELARPVAKALEATFGPVPVRFKNG